MRGRMALVIAGINCTVREVDLKNKPAEMLEASPKGTVPVVVLNDGTVIEESLDVMKWALSINDPEGWMDLTPAQMDEGETLITRNDNEFTGANHRYKYFERYPERSKEDYRADCEPWLQTIEAKLSENGGFLFAGKPCYVDVALFPFLRQFSKVDEKWYENAPYTLLKKWVKHFSETPYFEKAMTKFDVWENSQAPVTLL